MGIERVVWGVSLGGLSKSCSSCVTTSIVDQSVVSCAAWEVCRNLALILSFYILQFAVWHRKYANLQECIFGADLVFNIHSTKLLKCKGSITTTEKQSTKSHLYISLAFIETPDISRTTVDDKSNNAVCMGSTTDRTPWTGAPELTVSPGTPACSPGKIKT